MKKVARSLDILVVIVLGSVALGFADGTNDPPDMRSEGVNRGSPHDGFLPVSVHGRVVDQDGSAVSGADVCISWEPAPAVFGRRDAGRENWTRSNADGSWEFSIVNPRRAYAAAKKDGYQYVYSRDADRNLAEDKTSKENPFVIRLRRRGETTFLIIRPSGNRGASTLIRASSRQSEAAALDVMADGGTQSGRGAGYEDLRIEVCCARAAGEWTITYKAINGTDGIVVGTNRLYEAPQDGYQKEVVASKPPWPKYIYLRSRVPAIYSLLELEYDVWLCSTLTTNEGFQISYKAWINPYGERNLEYEPDLAGQWQLRQQLEQAAKIALFQNKLPTKPDLPKLIKEAQEKAEKEKSEH